MRPAAARLLLLNGAPAYRRLAGIVAGVALGVGILLILLGGYLQMPERDHRAAWRNTGGEAVTEVQAESAVQGPEPMVDAALRLLRVDYFRGDIYEVVAVAATDGTQVTLPGGLALPGPGEYYASPALSDMAAAHPADQLADRFGTSLGELPATLLKGPSDAVVLMGVPWQELAQQPNASVLTEFPDSGSKFDSGLYRFILAVGSITVLVPIVLLISIVAQLGASERRERFATARLIGAGRRSVASLSGAEMGAASLVGAALGVGVAALGRPVAAGLSVNGTTSFYADLTPSWGWTVSAVVGVGLLGGATAWWRTFRDDVGALGSSRERAEKGVTAWRSVTLLVGLVLFAGPAVAFHVNPNVPQAIMLVMLLGFAVTAFGIVVAGPWMTRTASRFFGKSTRSASGLVAAGRLSRHPRATFRSVAGLVVAVFVVSVFSGVVSAIEPVAAARESPGYLSMDAVVVSTDTAAETEATVAAVTDVPGAQRLVVAFADPDQPSQYVLTPDDARAVGAVDVPDAPGVVVDLDAMLAGETQGGDEEPPKVEATGAATGRAGARVMVVTDGDPASKERVRTAMETVDAIGEAPVTRADVSTVGTLSFTHELEVMAYLGMAVAIGISALSLTVATVAAALDRKRTFGLLRLSGMAARDLRRVITTEATVPLAATLVISGALGFGAAWVMIMTLGNGITMGWPDARYWMAIAGSVAIAALAIASSFGMVRRSTEVAATRFE